MSALVGCRVKDGIVARGLHVDAGYRNAGLGYRPGEESGRHRGVRKEKVQRDRDHRNPQSA